MARTPAVAIECERLELDGMRYVVLRESVFESLCDRAGFRRIAASEGDAVVDHDAAVDRATLAEKLSRRRRACGLSQAELARRAGVRPETINRIERGRTTPDFATVRKLAIAMAAAENALATRTVQGTSRKESNDEHPTWPVGLRYHVARRRVGGRAADRGASHGS